MSCTAELVPLWSKGADLLIPMSVNHWLWAVRRLRVVLGSGATLVSSDGHNKIPWPGWLKQQEFISHSSRCWEGAG